MCKVRDIILVDGYLSKGRAISKHSFIVMDDSQGKIQGLDYDMIGSALSSFKDEEQKNRKLSYARNFPIANEDTSTNLDNGKDGYLKTDQLYYFKKDR